MDKRKYTCLFCSAFSVFLLVAFDQLCKLLTIARIKNGGDIVLVKNVLILTYVENRGAAFGIMQGRNVFFFIITALLLAVDFWCYVKLLSHGNYRLLRILCTFIAAGGIGNLLDRIFRGFVVDMIYFKPINFPVFNVADCYITVSAAILIIAFVFIYKEDDFSFILPKPRKCEK